MLPTDNVKGTVFLLGYPTTGYWLLLARLLGYLLLDTWGLFTTLPPAERWRNNHWLVYLVLFILLDLLFQQSTAAPARIFWEDPKR
jgi:hypothetical protein